MAAIEPVGSGSTLMQIYNATQGAASQSRVTQSVAVQNTEVDTQAAQNLVNAQTSGNVAAALNQPTKANGTATEKKTITDKNNTAEDVTPEQQVAEQEAKNGDQLKKAVDTLNKAMPNSEVLFGYHEATHRIMLKIVDKDTKKVIQEVPPEKTLDMIAKVWEMAGILVDEKR